MGGLTPYEPLPGCIPPPRGVPWAWAGLEVRLCPAHFGCHGNHTPRGIPRGANPCWGGIHSREGSQGVIVHPRGWFPWSNPPLDGPPYQGFSGGSIPGRFVTDVYRFLGLSWETSSHGRVLFTLTTCLHGYMFFFQMTSSGEITSSIV